MDGEAQRLHRAVGRRVRALREAQEGLTQERLADRAGFHPTFVGKVERGESDVTMDTLAALCTALGMTLAEFFEPFRHSFRVRGPRRRRRRSG